ncbi:DNA cytosine methyltransferase [Rhodococcus triatomae]|uniref:Cytosine-specific methyltransferase n=1 Tax=Rhodococcus triatomae TaxID=300028 RepID=A0A1G8M5T2_9NOCA|nr:DNA cytosine methyltransferase [Rhodococcus triatomae]QNG18187.1 DNA cytosine methyltransferase [Rhodococcus triatomae]QNG22143.1 DNA cytosine methyltransferase [Rhodococcus triatomae]SDI63309.1 DNA (cytosine-5)-methyltransferase 1 [Rhodococcus triatomae]
MNSVRTLIDLFAGCGGMTSGFTAEGFTSTLAIEFDLHAAATYAANFGEDHTLWKDIGAVRNQQIPKADVVIGGPPCQGFSNLGSRDVDDPRNQLWREYLRVVRAANPKVFVIENVDRFMRSQEFELLLAEADHGSLKRYELSYGHLNAADFGVGQRRKRTIVIGSRIGKIELPAATHARVPDARNVAPWVTTRERIGDAPETPTSTSLPDSTVRVFGENVPGVFKGLDIHLGRTPTPLSLQRYDHVPPGGGRFDVPDHLLPRCWREKPSGTTDVMGRMRWDMPSHTIRTEFFKPEKGAYLHPQWDALGKHRVNRPITHYEAALLQDFPEDFLWCGSKIQIAKQIGNAVPVGLARAIAKHISDYL